MPNPGKKDASLEGELICGTAQATTEDSLSDAQFGVGQKGIIALKRKVEYYQWVEHSESKSEDKLGGKEVTTTTYTYSQQWVSSPVQSSQFKDPAYQNKNFVLTTVEDAEQYAENVRLRCLQTEREPHPQYLFKRGLRPCHQRAVAEAIRPGYPDCLRAFLWCAA